MPLSIRQIYKVRQKIVDRLQDPFEGKILEGDDIFRFAEALAKALGSRVDVTTVYRSVLPMLRQKITIPALELLAHRLAGNIDRLINMRPVLPWDGHPDPITARAEIMGMKLTNNKRGDVLYLYTVQLHTDHVAGLVTTKGYKRGYLGAVAVDLGFSRRPSGSYLFEHPRQLVGFHALAVVEGVPDPFGKPVIRRLESNPSLRTWNRRLTNLRLSKNDRDAVYPCPHQLKHPCHDCPVGYLPSEAGDPQCDLAVQPTAYRWDRCSACGENAFFNGEESLQLCLKCYAREVFSRQRRK